MRYYMRRISALLVIAVGLCLGGATCEHDDSSSGTAIEDPRKLDTLETDKYRADNYIVTVIDEIDMVCIKPLSVGSRMRRGDIGCFPLSRTPDQ